MRCDDDFLGSAPLDRPVLVVGAGVAGLQAARALLKRGLKVVVLEQSEDVGGVWIRNYAGYGLQVPWVNYQFPEFPYPRKSELEEYPSGEQVREYVQAYARNFGLYRHILFSCRLISLRRKLQPAPPVSTGPGPVAEKTQGPSEASAASQGRPTFDHMSTLGRSSPSQQQQQQGQAGQGQGQGSGGAPSGGQGRGSSNLGLRPQSGGYGRGDDGGGGSRQGINALLNSTRRLGQILLGMGGGNGSSSCANDGGGGNSADEVPAASAVAFERCGSTSIEMQRTFGGASLAAGGTALSAVVEKVGGGGATGNDGTSSCSTCSRDVGGAAVGGSAAASSVPSGGVSGAATGGAATANGGQAISQGKPSANGNSHGHSHDHGGLDFGAGAAAGVRGAAPRVPPGNRASHPGLDGSGGKAGGGGGGGRQSREQRARQKKERKSAADGSVHNSLVGDGWLALYEDMTTGRQYMLDVSFVVLATGLYATPFIPAIPGQELYRGLQVHSKDFTDAGVAAGKRVLVVGAGKTAADIVTELTATSAAAAVTLLYRRPHWPLPRTVGPVTIKALAYTRLISSALLPHYYDAGPAQRAMAGCLTPLRKAFWIRFMSRVNTTFNVKKKMGTPDRPICQDIWYSGQVLDAVKWPHVINNPKVQTLQGEVDHFTPVSAVLRDGTELEPDIVLYATGYSNQYSFLEPDVRQAINVQHDGVYLYRHVLVPGLPGLGFVGAEVSTFNNILTAALQGEWLASALSGAVSLPPPATMAADVAAQMAWRRRTMPPHKLRGSSVMLYMQSYHDQLIRDMGARTHRKKPSWRHPMAECFEAYTALDYADVFAASAKQAAAAAAAMTGSATAAAAAAAMVAAASAAAAAASTTVGGGEDGAADVTHSANAVAAAVAAAGTESTAMSPTVVGTANASCSAGAPTGTACASSMRASTSATPWAPGRSSNLSYGQSYGGVTQPHIHGYSSHGPNSGGGPTSAGVVSATATRTDFLTSPKAAAAAAAATFAAALAASSGNAAAKVPITHSPWTTHNAVKNRASVPTVGAHGGAAATTTRMLTPAVAAAAAAGCATVSGSRPHLVAVQRASSFNPNSASARAIAAAEASNQNAMTAAAAARSPCLDPMAPSEMDDDEPKARAVDEQDTLYSLDALPPALQVYRRTRVRPNKQSAAAAAAAAGVVDVMEEYDEEYDDDDEHDRHAQHGGVAQYQQQCYQERYGAGAAATNAAVAVAAAATPHRISGVDASGAAAGGAVEAAGPSPANRVSGIASFGSSGAAAAPLTPRRTTSGHGAVPPVRTSTPGAAAAATLASRTSTGTIGSGAAGGAPGPSSGGTAAQWTTVSHLTSSSGAAPAGAAAAATATAATSPAPPVLSDRLARTSGASGGGGNSAAGLVMGRVDSGSGGSVASASSGASSRRPVKRGFSLATMLLRRRGNGAAAAAYDVSSSRIELTSPAVSELAYKVLPPRHVEEALAAAAAAAVTKAAVAPAANATSRRVTQPGAVPAVATAVAPLQRLIAAPATAAPPAVQLQQPSHTGPRQPPPSPQPQAPQHQGQAAAPPPRHAARAASVASTADTSLFSGDALLPVPPLHRAGNAADANAADADATDADAPQCGYRYGDRDNSFSASSGISYTPSCSTVAPPQQHHHHMQLQLQQPGHPDVQPYGVDPVYGGATVHRSPPSISASSGVSYTPSCSTVAPPPQVLQQQHYQRQSYQQVQQQQTLVQQQRWSEAEARVYVAAPQQQLGNPSGMNYVQAGSNASPPRLWQPVGGGTGVYCDGDGAGGERWSGARAGGREGEGDAGRRRVSGTSYASSGISYTPSCSTVAPPQMLYAQR